MRLLSLFAVLLAGPAVAGPLELTDLQSVKTRFGEVAVVDADIDGLAGHQVQWNGADIPGLKDVYVGVQAVLPAAAGTADYVLVSAANGGNGCPMMWYFLEVSAAGATPSDQFGTCSEQVLDLRLTVQGIEADLASFDPALDHETFAWDGVHLTDTVVKRTTDGAVAAGAGEQATRWIGQHPALPFDDAGERLRFQTIMSEDQVYELATRVTVASTAVESDGFVVGQGFDPASGGDAKGMWGIRISDGAPFAIFLDAGQPHVTFGMGEEDLPTAAVLFIEGIQN